MFTGFSNSIASYWYYYRSQFPGKVTLASGHSQPHHLADKVSVSLNANPAALPHLLEYQLACTSVVTLAAPLRQLN